MTLFDLVANRQYQNKHVLTKLIEHHTGVPYKEIIMHYDDEISWDKAGLIDSDYRKYEKEKMPLEYIVGHVDFLGNSFFIDGRGMIPRPETEYMIQAVLEGMQATSYQLPATSFNILDLWCGCGVLGLSVGSLCNTGNWKLATGSKIYSIQSWDLSPDAVELTKKNIEKYRDRLSWVELGTQVSEWLSELKNKPELLERWQKNPLIIVCNYPYIPDETFEENADECAKTWEPRMAFLGGSDGLDLYRVLFGEIVDYGLTHAVLYLEMMTWQLEILNAEFWSEVGGNWKFETVKTFHFNIIIVKAEHKKL